MRPSQAAPGAAFNRRVMTKNIADQVARSELVADLHDKVPPTLRFVNRPLSRLDHGLDLTLVDRHSPPGVEKVLLEVDEEKCATAVMRCVGHPISMTPPKGCGLCCGSLVIPARRATRRTIRAAPCRSSRLPSAALRSALGPLGDGQVDGPWAAPGISSSGGTSFNAASMTSGRRALRRSGQSEVTDIIWRRGGVFRGVSKPTRNRSKPGRLGCPGGSSASEATLWCGQFSPSVATPFHTSDLHSVFSSAPTRHGRCKRTVESA